MTTERKKHHPIRREKKPERENPDDSYGSTGGVRRYGAAKKPDEALNQGPRRERRSLSHVGGEVSFQGGTPEERDVLLRALDVSSDEGEVMVDVHGFHSYPARLHPDTARELITGFSKPGDRVLDPFCGSGTVVLESRALGREALGSDLNPLAVELSWLKSRGPSPKLVAEMVHAASSVAEVAEDRRQVRAEPHHRYTDEDRERYPIHILLELDSLASGITALSGTEIRRMLRLVISSTLTKLSNSEGDTTRRMAPRRLPSGFAIQLFHQKAEELARRLDAYGKRVSDKAPRATVACSDARELEEIESDSIDLIITSPPYPGVYDYLDHHLHRIQWLGLKEGGLRDRELGARREYKYLRLEEAAAKWRSEIGPTLYVLRRTLAQDGRGVMVIADSVVDRKPLRADQQIRMVAEKAGIDITCIASQERPLFLHGADQAFANGPRMEHVVVFRPGYQKPRVDKKNKVEVYAPEERVRPARFRKFDEERMLAADREAEKQGPPPPVFQKRSTSPRADSPGGFRGDDRSRPTDPRSNEFARGERTGREFPRQDRPDSGGFSVESEPPRPAFTPTADSPRPKFRDRPDVPREDYSPSTRAPRTDYRPAPNPRDRQDAPRQGAPYGEGPPRPNYRDGSEGPRQNFRERGDAPRPNFNNRGDAPRQSFRERNEGPRQNFNDRGDAPRQNFRERGDGPRQNFRERGDGPRQSFRSESSVDQARGPAQFRPRDDHRGAAPGDRDARRPGPQRESQAKTWDSSPRGDRNPRSNPRPKPK